MNLKPTLLLSSKLLETCSCNKESAIYSLLPLTDTEPNNLRNKYIRCLENHPHLIDASFEILLNKRTSIAKNSYLYTKIKKDKDKLIESFSKNKDLLGISELKIEKDKISAALALVSSIYFESFTQPVQFFLPNSSACSGQWKFWEDNNYFRFLEDINEEKFNLSFMEKIAKSDIWNAKFQPTEFPEIIKKRLIKEQSLEKKLCPEAMIKAIIIRMGELGRPFVNYENIDYSIRKFFVYLGIKKYLRIDREILFLRRLEKEIICLLSLNNN